MTATVVGFDIDLHPVVPCACVDVDLGTYANAVVMTSPWTGRPVDIDRCMAPLVVALWDAGICTVASCCGHGGKAPQSLVIRVVAA